MYRSRFSLEGDSLSIELEGDFESQEILDLIEFYKSKGYNKITSDYEKLTLTKETEGNTQIKEIEDLRFDIKRHQEYHKEKNKEIERLEQQIQKILNDKTTTLEQYDAFIKLNESNNQYRTKLTALQKEAGDNFFDIKEKDREIKDLKEKIKKMKEVFLKRLNEEPKE